MMSTYALRERLFSRALTAKDRATIDAVLDHFPEHLMEKLIASGTTIVPLAMNERYVEASAMLRRLGLDVDAWPAPPAGLFVVEERALYLRRMTRMTVAHELGHALDCALGDGVYLSGIDPQIRRAFSAARRFVTAYASTASDEYFAEGIRAFCGLNDETSPWPPANRERLKRIDPALHAIISGIFENSARGRLPSDALSRPDSGIGAVAASSW